MSLAKQTMQAHNKAAAARGTGKKGEYFVPVIPGMQFPEQTRTQYSTWLVVRYASGDRGERPLPGGSVFWESPDVWVKSSVGINQPVPGEANTVYARVLNLGLEDATGIFVKFWWANPALAITEATAHLIGVGTINELDSGSCAVVECPEPWVPVVENNGHECLLAEAFIPTLDDLDAPMDPADDRHVGQKNEQLLIVTKGASFSMKLEAVNVTGMTQMLTFEVQALRLKTIPALLQTRGQNLRLKLLPPTAAVPLNLRVAEAAASYTGPSAWYARRLLSMTLQEVAGTARDCFAPAQISHQAQFQPWETRTVEVAGQVPHDAAIGQTYLFRVIQRAGRMITGGYTVHVVVGDR